MSGGPSGNRDLERGIERHGGRNEQTRFIIDGSRGRQNHFGRRVIEPKGEGIGVFIRLRKLKGARKEGDSIGSGFERNGLRPDDAVGGLNEKLFKSRKIRRKIALRGTERRRGFRRTAGGSVGGSY